MIGPRLKACLFVIGRCKQSSLPPPLSDTRRLTHTHFSLRPLSSPLWRCNQDGNKKPVESYCIWMKCFLTLQHQWGRTHSWRVSMPPPSRPCWENGDWSGDLLVRSFSCFFCFFSHCTSLFVCYFSWAYIRCSSVTKGKKWIAVSFSFSG